MARKDTVIERLKRLIDGFARYLDVFDATQPFGTADAHLAPLARLAEVGRPSAAVADPKFQHRLWDTLHAWGLNTRASVLVPFDDFAGVVAATGPYVEGLEGFHLDDPNLDVEATEARVWTAMEAISPITTNKAKLVAASKALHHILPELVMPIDRWYTARFFGWHGPEMQNSQRNVFRRTWTALSDVARRVEVGRFVGADWRSSRGKLVDNALVGFCIAELSSPEVIGPDLSSTQVVLEDFAEERDWDQFHTPKNLAMALSAEAGELLEIFQWLTDEQSTQLEKGDRDRVAEELADVQIYIARLADVLSLDMKAAVEAKIEMNAAKYPVDVSRGDATKYDLRPT